MFELVRNNFLSIRRSPLFGNVLVVYIFILFVLGYLYTRLFSFGLYLDEILLVMKPEMTPIDAFSIFFIYFIILDIILKFLFKSTKQFDILPYLTMPIPHAHIYILLFIKELLSIWNFIWIIILAPFFFKTVYIANGLTSTLLLIFSTYIVSVTISFIVRYLSIRKSIWHTSISLFLVVCVGYIAYAVVVTPCLLIDIDWIFQHKMEVFVGLICLFFSLFVVFRIACRREIYSLSYNKRKFAIVFNTIRSNSFSIKGEIINLCLREIARGHLKRKLLQVTILLVACLYTLNRGWGNFLSQCLIVLLPTIILGRIYGENTFNVESTFFDKLMISPHSPPYLILKTKYTICVIHAAINTTISIIVCTNNTSILFWISTFFYGCGGLLFFFFQNAVYNNQRIDILDSPRKFPFITITTIIIMVFVILLTGFIVITIRELTSETTAEYFMLILGIAGMSTSSFWLRNICNRFMARKYKAMDNFRNI